VVCGTPSPSRSSSPRTTSPCQLTDIVAVAACRARSSACLRVWRRPSATSSGSERWPVGAAPWRRAGGSGWRRDRSRRPGPVRLARTAVGQRRATVEASRARRDSRCTTARPTSPRLRAVPHHHRGLRDRPGPGR
jgi:hypothetical protein